MKKFIAFVMLFAGLFSISYNAFEQDKIDESETQNIVKEDKDEVRSGTENEGVFLF